MHDRVHGSLLLALRYDALASRGHPFAFLAANGDGPRTLHKSRKSCLSDLTFPRAAQEQFCTLLSAQRSTLVSLAWTGYAQYRPLHSGDPTVGRVFHSESMRMHTEVGGIFQQSPFPTLHAQLKPRYLYIGNKIEGRADAAGLIGVYATYQINLDRQALRPSQGNDEVGQEVR